jgi:hypothetical protein
MKIHANFTSFYWWLGLIALFIIPIGGHESLAYDLAEYSPLQVGDVRLYLESETKGGQTRLELSREPISRTETIGGVETFVRGELSSGCWCEEYEALAWDQEGLKIYRQVEYDGGELESIDYAPPLLMAPRQLDLNQTKSWSVQEGGENMEVEVTLESVENITVYAGTFNNCLRIQWRFGSGDGSETCRSWFAEGIGMVKEECTMTEDGQTSTEYAELVATAVNGSLYGSPLRPGELFSFYLAHISTNSCGEMLMENVAIGLPGETPGLWWIKFVLNLSAQPVAWTITDFGQGPPPSLDPSSASACAIPGLDLSQALHKMNINDQTLDPQLWMRFPYDGNENYAVAGFCFPPERLSWDLYFALQVAE